MTLEITLARRAPARTALHAVAIASDSLGDGVDGADMAVLESRGFDGSVGQVMITAGAAGPIAVVGMGPAADVGTTAFRRAGASVARAAKRHAKISADVLGVAPEGMAAPDAAQAFAEGLALGRYEYLETKSDPEPSKLRAVTLVGTGARIRAGVDRGLAIGDGVNLARDLVNEPGGSLTPTAFARRATAVAKHPRLTAKVLDAAAIKRARMGGLMGVNRGSSQQPRFVQLTYRPKGRATRHIALVGKGITFDAGGLSIKTGQGMMTMKCDMAGAAAVLGTMAAIAELEPKVKVTAFIPLTDNMLGGDATRPGDVLKIRNGTTVEVLNTDAEGRLILADALSMACEAKPDAIVDLATLTGACMVALGPRYAGLMGNDQEWIDTVLASGARTGERVWQLPLPPEYRSMLDSNVADVKNIGGAYGGAITAGLFLKEFVVDEIPWAHIDLAGPAFTDSAWEEHPKGGTGFGVRLLVDLVTNGS